MAIDVTVTENNNVIEISITEPGENDVVEVAAAESVATVTVTEDGEATPISVTVQETNSSVEVMVTEPSTTAISISEPVTAVTITVTEHAGPKGEKGDPGTTGSTLREMLIGTPDDVINDFLASEIIVFGTETVYVNGLAQRPTLDYTVDSKTVTFSEPPEMGDYLQISYSYATGE